MASEGVGLTIDYQSLVKYIWSWITNIADQYSVDEDLKRDQAALPSSILIVHGHSRACQNVPMLASIQ